MSKINSFNTKGKVQPFLLFHHSVEFTVMCEVDDILRNLNALFATRDPFAAKKATETWQNYESVLRKETVQKYT